MRARALYLQEEPLGESPLLWHKDALIEGSEAVQHPCLLVVRQVLDGQVVAHCIARLHQILCHHSFVPAFIQCKITLAFAQCNCINV